MKSSKPKRKFSKRTIRWMVFALCMILQGAMYRGLIWNTWKKDYAPQGGLVKGTGLSPDQFLFALAGFREMVAGILWVRADSFFDSGNFDAVLPIIRLVTILDPKQIDVYTTGMWHIAYNFTDEDERSDRRYIASALALGKEGAKQNPDTYELWFELGWTWYNKIDDDYPNAVKYFTTASQKEDVIPARLHLLAFAQQRTGDVDAALKTQFSQMDKAADQLKKENSMGAFEMHDTLENNTDTLLVRASQRGWFARQRGDKDLSGYDIYPPYDVKLKAKISVVESRVLKIEGGWDVLPLGCRLRVILRDKDYKHMKTPYLINWDYLNDVLLDPPKEDTLMLDSLFIKNRHFSETLDLSKDPTQYPFKSDKYILELYYNPRSAPPHIQDRFGFSGEGMTDKNYLRGDVRDGQRVVYATFELTRDQLLRQGDWSLDGGKMPVITTKGWQDKAAEQGDEVIQVPSLRSGAH
jgi:hypothetical protein